MTKQLINVVVGGALLAAAGALAARAGQATGAAAVPTPRVVRVAEVTSGAGQRTVHVAGVTRAVHRADLSFAVPGRLARRGVQVGDRVAAGSELAALDARELQHAQAAAEASLAEVEARLGQATAERARVDRLAAAAAATTEEVERAAAAVEGLQAARDAATARLADARRALGEARLAAPFAGTVTAVRAEPGEWLAPGRPVVELAGDGGVEVELALPASLVPRVHPGEPVALQGPAGGSRRFAGRLTSIAAAARSGGLFPALVTVDPSADVEPGVPVAVDLEVTAGDGLSVPLAAVLDPGSSRPAVFAVRGGVARRLPVQVATLLGDRVEVVPGALAAGDRVVVAGQTRLVDGDRVEVR